MNDIIITDIYGSHNIQYTTPLIILYNVPHRFLNLIKDKIYTVNTCKLYKMLYKKISYIDKFIPIGQITENNKFIYTIIMANKHYVETTNTFKKINKDTWIGINNKNHKTIGTIYSKNVPHDKYPVFANNLLTHRSFKFNDIYKDLYSDTLYGRWKLNLNNNKIVLPKNINDYNHGQHYNFFTQNKLIFSENKFPWYKNVSIIDHSPTHNLTNKKTVEYFNTNTETITYVICIIMILLLMCKRH